MKHETAKRMPEPHPDCETSKPERVRIGGAPCVEMTGEKWLGLLQTSEFYTKGKRL